MCGSRLCIHISEKERKREREREREYYIYIYRERERATEIYIHTYYTHTCDAPHGHPHKKQNKHKTDSRASHQTQGTARTRLRPPGKNGPPDPRNRVVIWTLAKYTQILYTPLTPISIWRVYDRSEGSPKRDISSLRVLVDGGGQVWRILPPSP